MELLQYLNFFSDQTEEIDLEKISLTDEDLIFIDVYVEKRGLRLQKLSVSENNLTWLPNFTGLTYLTSLTLSNNQFTWLPTFSGLENLTRLDLSDNRLTWIPDLLFLPRLTVLNLSGNYLRMVPDFTSLPNLTGLHLADNLLTTVPPFTRLSHLIYLDLRNNKLRNIPRFTFFYLILLRLTGNLLDEPPDRQRLPYLMQLDVDVDIEEKTGFTCPPSLTFPSHQAMLRDVVKMTDR